MLIKQGKTSTDLRDLDQQVNRACGVRVQPGAASKVIKQGRGLGSSNSDVASFVCSWSP